MGEVAERPLPPLVDPTSTTGLAEVFRRRYLLRLLVRREIQARYQGSVLGMIWSYINPLSQFFIYWLVMGKVMGMEDRAPAFPIHVFTGLLIVHFFNETFNSGTRSIVRNRKVVQKMAVPREMFPVSSMLVSAFHAGPQLVILVIACLIYGWTPDAVGLGSAVLGLAIAVALATSVALMFSVLNVFLRDVSNGVNILTNFVRFGVPMIYPYTLVEERFGSFADYYLWNPLAQSVLLVQRGFWVGATSDPEATAAHHLPEHLVLYGVVGLVVSLVLLAVAQWVFSRFEGKIPERL